MTTIVYKKWKWIAADKREIWWEPWHRDETLKIFTLIWDNYKVYLWFSWRAQIREVIDSILSKHFWKEFDASRIVDLRDDLSKASCGANFWTILVYHKLEFDAADAIIRAFHVDEAWFTEAYGDFAASWSWSNWVDWILTAVPDMEPDKLFELVSSKDLNTSPIYDIINFL